MKTKTGQKRGMDAEPKQKQAQLSAAEAVMGAVAYRVRHKAQGDDYVYAEYQMPMLPNSIGNFISAMAGDPVFAVYYHARNDWNPDPAVMTFVVDAYIPSIMFDLNIYPKKAITLVKNQIIRNIKKVFGADTTPSLDIIGNTLSGFVRGNFTIRAGNVAGVNQEFGKILKAMNQGLLDSNTLIKQSNPGKSTAKEHLRGYRHGLIDTGRKALSRPVDFYNTNARLAKNVRQAITKFRLMGADRPSRDQQQKFLRAIASQVIAATNLILDAMRKNIPQVNLSDIEIQGLDKNAFMAAVNYRVACDDIEGAKQNAQYILTLDDGQTQLSSLHQIAIRLEDSTSSMEKAINFQARAQGIRRKRIQPMNWDKIAEDIETAATRVFSPSDMPFVRFEGTIGNTTFAAEFTGEWNNKTVLQHHWPKLLKVLHGLGFKGVQFKGIYQRLTGSTAVTGIRFAIPALNKPEPMAGFELGSV